MAILKHNQEPWILRLLISDHGVLFFLLLFLHNSTSATAQISTVPPAPPNELATEGQEFNPTMAIIMVVLISAFFLMGFFSVYIRQCAERRLPRNNNTDPYAVFLGGTNYRSRRVARGLDTSVMNTFPTFVYSVIKGHKIGKSTLECAVCLNEFEDDETLRLIPKCSHVFHIDCIDAWLASHTTCPVCRANLVPQPGEIVSCVVQICNPDNDSGDPSWRSDNPEEISQADQRRDVESPELNLNNQNRPPRSRSTGWRLGGLLPRSHSTGHSLVQPGENCERFTLRLPDEVRIELMNSSLSRSKSCVVFPRVRSSRRGFRSRSGGIGRSYYERFDRQIRSGHWGFSMTPPFISRTRSLGPPNVGDEITCTPPKKLFKIVKSSSDRLLARSDNEGERSFDRLRTDTQV